MRDILIIAVCFLSFCTAQDDMSAVSRAIKSFVLYEHRVMDSGEFECPTSSVDTTIVFVGYITRIISPIKFDFVRPDFDFLNETPISERTKAVVLAGLNVGDLSTSDSGEVIMFLRRKLFDRDDLRVEVSTKAFRKDSVVLYGEIIIGDKSLNYSLLKNGLGIYEEQLYGELDRWEICRFQKAVEFAQKHRKGIWHQN